MLIQWKFSTSPTMALVVPDKNAFQHILRLLNTNVDGKEKVMFALTRIKGVGRRYSNIVIKKADVDLNKRYFSISFSQSTFFQILDYLALAHSFTYFYLVR